MFLRATGWSLAGVVILMVAVVPGCVERQELCDICGVPIPEPTHAVVRTTAGDELSVCDPRCALTHQEQTGEALVLTGVTDFETGASLVPSEAVYVTGSDVAPDAHQETLRSTQQDVAERHWHRCLPSVLSFAMRDAADRFRTRNGGEVTTLEALEFAEAGR